MPRISNTFYRIQKAQGKKMFHGAIAPDSPWTFFFRERDWEWTNICTFLNMAQYLVAWLRLPFSREVVIWTVPGYTFIERWKTFDAKIWSKKNMHTQWEKEKRWVIEIYMPNWWNSDEVKRLVFFSVVAPFLDRVLLYFAKMGQNQSNSCNESPFNLLAYCRNDFHSRQFGDRKFLNCIFKLALESDRSRVWGQECVFSLSLCVCFYVSI